MQVQGLDLGVRTEEVVDGGINARADRTMWAATQIGTEYPGRNQDGKSFYQQQSTMYNFEGEQQDEDEDFAGMSMGQTVIQ